jgi:hypothetical protein
MYLVRLGFMDGRVGWHLAMLMASYEYMISLLYRDKLVRRREATQSEEPAEAAPKLGLRGKAS